MDPRILLTLIKKEIRDALTDRWFVIYGATFTGLILLLSWLSLSGAGSGYRGLAGFGRTAAGLINLILLIVPLMALSVGAGSLAGERERGTLQLLLSQPLNRAELLLGKYLGLAAALLGTLAFGFGLSGLIIARAGAQTEIGSYLSLFSLAFLLALGMLSVGFLVSILARRTAVANSTALLLWLFFVFAGDLGLMGSSTAFKLNIRTLFDLALLNPLQVFKMSTLSQINASLDVLGPAGLYAVQTYGQRLSWLLLAVLLAWIILPLGGTYLIFQRRGDV